MLKRKQFADSDCIYNSVPNCCMPSEIHKFADLKKYVNRIVKIKSGTREVETYKYVVGIGVWNRDWEEKQFHFFELRHLSGDASVYDKGITINGGIEDFIIV